MEETFAKMHAEVRLSEKKSLNYNLEICARDIPNKSLFILLSQL
jgi:hypothetical protein